MGFGQVLQDGAHFERADANAFLLCCFSDQLRKWGYFDACVAALTLNRRYEDAHALPPAWIWRAGKLSLRDSMVSRETVSRGTLVLRFISLLPSSRFWLWVTCRGKQQPALRAGDRRRGPLVLHPRQVSSSSTRTGKPGTSSRTVEVQPIGQVPAAR